MRERVQPYSWPVEKHLSWNQCSEPSPRIVWTPLLWVGGPQALGLLSGLWVVVHWFVCQYRTVFILHLGSVGPPARFLLLWVPCSPLWALGWACPQMQKASCEFCRDRLDFVVHIREHCSLILSLIVGEHSASFRLFRSLSSSSLLLTFGAHIFDMYLL